MIPRAFFYFPIFKIVAVIPIKDNLIAKGSLLIKLFWKYEATLSKYVWYLTKHLTKTCETIGHCPKTNWQGRRNWGGGQEGQLPLLSSDAFWAKSWGVILNVTWLSAFAFIGKSTLLFSVYSSSSNKSKVKQKVNIWGTVDILTFSCTSHLSLISKSQNILITRLLRL
jgi:hypothetical protein